MNYFRRTGMFACLCIPLCLPVTGAACAWSAEGSANRRNAADRLSAPDGPGLLVYLGTYTDGESEGIYLYRLDRATGRLTAAGVVPNVVNPSFLALHPTRPLLYAVNSVSDYGGGHSGAVTAFDVDRRSGALSRINQQPSGGPGPCHLVVAPGGRHVLVANYQGGSVAVLPIRTDGGLGEATARVQHEGASVHPRQQVPHAHSIQVDPAGRFALAADLGLDKVLVYRFDADTGTLVPNDPPAARVAPGSGPRHLALAADGRHAYVINEIRSTITSFSYDAQRGVLDRLDTVSTLPTGFSGENTTAEVKISPDGRFLYGSNRGHDSIAIFSIDGPTGRITPAGHEPTGGQTPRNFGIDPSGRYLLAANQQSDSVRVFRIDRATGGLTPTDFGADVPTPVCVAFASW